jgi:hypothetical protein
MPGFKGEPGLSIRGPKVCFIHALSECGKVDLKTDVGVSFRSR